jgi:hypothetical protein
MLKWFVPEVVTNAKFQSVHWSLQCVDLRMDAVVSELVVDGACKACPALVDSNCLDVNT